jgi:NitT/TauT family transport system substrate-binding protein
VTSPHCVLIATVLAPLAPIVGINRTNKNKRAHQVLGISRFESRRTSDLQMPKGNRGLLITIQISNLAEGAVRKVLIGLSLFVLCLPLPGRAAEKVRFLLDYPYPEGIHAGIYLALDKGWYKDAGLDVEVIDGKGSNVTIQQVAAGQVDIGLAQLSAMATAVSNGLPVTSVMGILPKGDLAVVYGEDTGIKTLKDLKGHKIATAQGSAATALFDGFLKSAGLTRQDLDLVFIDSSAQLSAYTSKVVDGTLVTMSYFMPLVQDVRPAKAFLFADHGLTVPSYGLVANRSAIQNSPELLRKLVAATQRGWTYVLDGHEQEGVDAIMRNRVSMRPDPKVLMGMLKLNETQIGTPATKGLPFGTQAMTDWQEALTVLQQASLVQPGWNAADYFTNQLIPAK